MHDDQPQPHTLAIALMVIAVLAGLCQLVLNSGCAVRGTRDTDAEAIDIYTARPPCVIPGDLTRTGSLATHGEPERYRYRHTTTGTKPPTFGQRVAGIFGNFTGAALVAIAFALVVAPAAVLAFALRRFLAIRAALRETVAGISAADRAGNAANVKAALSSAHSPTTKTIVANIRHAT